jgi:tetratricopeptide (TPR) repeat protein
LNRAIQAQPHDPRGYLQRASVQMVRGEYTAARSDCRELIVGGELAVGSVCMAQAAGATGNTERAEAMIRTLLSNGQQFDSPTRAWALATLADLARRRGADKEAEQFLRQAIDLAPTDDSIRCALADLLLDHAANNEVTALMSVERPSLALLLRKTIAQHRMKDFHVVETSRRFVELIEIDRQRSERAHLREEAMFALEVSGDPQAAAKLALANFKVQRESADIRLLARSAAAAGNSAAIKELRQWLALSGYRDRQLEPLLHAATT